MGGGGRQAWSAQSRSSDPRTKPTHWKFAGRGHPDEKLGYDNRVSLEDEEPVTSKAVDKQNVKIRDERRLKERQVKQQTRVEGYDEDDDQPEYHKIEQNIDDDSMRRAEMERGSDIGYARRGGGNEQGTRELFIKDGNAEILRLITRGKNEEENIYVNLPGRANVVDQGQPQYIMVDNGGKEILMRRYIEEQSNGKQIIREHYQVIPNATILQPVNAGDDTYQQPQERQQQKHISTVEINRPTGIEAETQVTHESPAHSIIHKELEDSLKQQNALLRQILLEKERLEERYNQQETALETQSLPCQSMAIATQTECETGTQTESAIIAVEKRRSRSENDDSLSEDDYEYIRYSPANSPSGVYWVKRKRHRVKTRYKPSERPRKVMEAVKRKIRTPILEETEEQQQQRKTPARVRIIDKPMAAKRPSRKDPLEERLKRDVLMEISDSLEDQQYLHKSDKQRKSGPRIYKKNIRYVVDSDGSEREVRQVIRRNYYSAESLNEASDTDSESERNNSWQRASRSTSPSLPAIVKANRLYQKELEEYRKKPKPSKPPKRPAPKPPFVSSTSPRLSNKFYTSESNLVQRMREEGMLDTPQGVARYMDWYYEKHRDKDIEADESRRVDKREISRGGKLRIKAQIRKTSQLKRGTPARLSRSDENLEKYKPEAAPRKSPPKPRLLKEEVELAKRVEKEKVPKGDGNHPLLQHSEHRFEHDYVAPTVPPPPTKLPHYLYPETPPTFSRVDSKTKSNKFSNKKKVSPIKENEIKHSRSQVPMEQLNVTSLEDDHDSGIAMNSLMHSLGRRNPIADKKSVFTIAYDDVRVNQIQSNDCDSPPFSNRS